MEELLLSILQRPENAIALVLLFLVIRKQAEQIDKMIEVIRDSNASLQYQINLERSKNDASKSRHPGDG